ncbi:MAG: Maf family protein [Lentisphaeria bacterium]
MSFQKLILASASPRRQEMLKDAGIAFTVQPAAIDEAGLAGESPTACVQRLAELKASSVAAQYPGILVLGADTLVVLQGKMFGKPGNLSEAREMLKEFSGRTHDVLTGVSLVCFGQQPCTWCSRTKVTFKPLDKAAIEHYFQLVNPLDKAGAYAIQEYGSLLIEKISGLKSNVIGLPIEEVCHRLEELQA